VGSFFDLLVVETPKYPLAHHLSHRSICRVEVPGDATAGDVTVGHHADDLVVLPDK
jgi:hypothetical protein